MFMAILSCRFKSSYLYDRCYYFNFLYSLNFSGRRRRGDSSILSMIHNEKRGKEKRVKDFFEKNKNFEICINENHGCNNSEDDHYSLSDCIDRITLKSMRKWDTIPRVKLGPIFEFIIILATLNIERSFSSLSNLSFSIPFFQGNDKFNIKFNKRPVIRIIDSFKEILHPSNFLSLTLIPSNFHNLLSFLPSKRKHEDELVEKESFNSHSPLVNSAANNFADSIFLFKNPYMPWIDFLFMINLHDNNLKNYFMTERLLLGWQVTLGQPDSHRKSRNFFHDETLVRIANLINAKLVLGWILPSYRLLSITNKKDNEIYLNVTDYMMSCKINSPHITEFDNCLIGNK